MPWNWEVKPGGKAQVHLPLSQFNSEEKVSQGRLQRSLDLFAQSSSLKIHPHSEPQFAHISNGDSNACTTGWLRKLC